MVRRRSLIENSIEQVLPVAKGATGPTAESLAFRLAVCLWQTARPHGLRMLDEEPTPGGLVKFHTAHKLTLMAHSPKHYTEMGRLVADAGKRDWDELTAEYGAMLMEGLSVMGTRGKHVNVLQHLMGYLKNHLSSEDKQELLGLIEDYRQALVPLIVPLTLLKHHLNRYPVPDWVHQQVYLHPYPKELMLRNHV
jgi:uncharacterized protein YbgA (DUF1722 family)